MNSLTRPEHYCSPDIFIKEVQKLAYFPKIIAHECELEAQNTKLIECYKKSLFLKKDTEHKPSCFLNVCPHRWAKLVDKSLANEDVICKYHGLNFSKGSCEKKLIKEEIFQIGKLILIGDQSLFPSSNSILTKEITSISEGFKKHLGQIKIEMKANWKIVVENTLESVHVKYVHPNFPKIDIHDRSFRYFEDGSTFWSPKTIDKSPLDRFFISNLERQGMYSIIHLFPLSFISTVEGISSSLVRLNPLDVDSTEVYIDVYIQDMKNDKIRETIEKQIYEATTQIFQEDKEVCELAQKGTRILHDNGHSFCMDLWPSEARINNFHKFYYESFHI